MDENNNINNNSNVEPNVADDQILLTEKKSFTVSKSEVIAAIASYIMAYYYVCAFNNEKWFGSMGIAALILIVLTEFLNKDKAVNLDSHIWLTCLVCSSASFVAQCYYSQYPHSMQSMFRVWGREELSLFIHVCAVFYILSRSNKLVFLETSVYAIQDGLNGFLIIPFKNFVLRIRTLLAGLRKDKKENEEKKSAEPIFFSIVVIIICLVFFGYAAKLLGKADSNFEGYIKNITTFWDETVEKLFEDLDILSFICSIPVGMYLFGLISGSKREDRVRIDEQKNRIDNFMPTLEKISANLWGIVVACFSVLYIAFFVVQGSYLFSALIGKLPGDYIYSEYARQGFFELCKVAAINAVILWMVTRFAKANSKNSVLYKVSFTVLNLESILFAIIAFAKLAMYIGVFGFTPLRFQSIWFVCVIFAGFVLWLLNFFLEKKLFKYWVYFSVLSLALLCVY